MIESGYAGVPVVVAVVLGRGIELPVGSAGRGQWPLQGSHKPVVDVWRSSLEESRLWVGVMTKQELWVWVGPC